MAQVTFSPNHQPLPACYPSDANGLLDMLTTGGGLSGTIPDTAGGGVFVGPNPPASSLTNKVWYKTDAAGRPLGVFMFYNGNWRKVYTGVAVGDIKMLWYYTGYFDGTGRGIIGSDWDGWAICNGQNGTPNLEGYFPVGGQSGESVGQTAGVWFTDADGVAWRNTGGQKARVVLNQSNIPFPTLEYKYHSQKFNVGSGGGQSPFCLVADPAQPVGYDAVLDSNGQYSYVNSSPTALPFQHLYVAIGFAMFVGYQ